MEKNREELIQGLEKLGITAGEEEVSKLISFSELLLKWNKVYNLTAIRDETSVGFFDFISLFQVVWNRSRM